MLVRAPVAASAAAKPWQRCSRAKLPASWMTHSAWRTWRALMRRPAVYPASYSSSPTCNSVPSLRNALLPELIDMTGIPARSAARIAGASALGFGSDTTRPAGLVAVALSDHLAHARDVIRIGGLVGDGHAELGRGCLGTVLDNSPERIGRLPVRDHEEPDSSAGQTEDVDPGRGAFGRIRRVGLDRRKSRLLRKRCVPGPATPRRRSAMSGVTAASMRRAAGRSCPGVRDKESLRSRGCRYPSGLSTISSPSSAATRSLSPLRPLPLSESAPPTPASLTSSVSTPSASLTLKQAWVAPAYLATFVNASAATK